MSSRVAFPYVVAILRATRTDDSRCMAHESDRAAEPEPRSRRFWLLRWVLAAIAIWLTIEAIGSVLAVVRRVVVLVVLVLLVMVGRRIARARKS
jgi:hypothetical protein